MLMDINMIKAVYENLPQRIAKAKNKLNRPLTFSEKILYSHLFDENTITDFKRGIDYAEFRPDRVAMQDATAQMALLQYILAGKDKAAVPASVHTDHLIMARNGEKEDIQNALIVNKEVYDFLSSVCEKFGIDFWKPGAGIIHQVVLENYAFPGGMIIGTDSHTPTAGGLGMVAVGVGGADAVDVMAGMPWELKFPKLLGIKLTGKLSGWASAKDIILKLAGILTVKGGTGYLIEYFGEGAESLSCTGKATICNMGAEIGATGSVFGYDNSMSRYLKSTGREEIAEYADKFKEHLTADEEIYQSPEKYFDQIIEINLSEIEPYINGPFTPDRATPISKMKEELEKNGWPAKVEAGLIGSCTNSSYEDISRVASVVKDAKNKNIQVKAELSINPGSEQIHSIIERDGFINILKNAGAKIFANACGPCIGQWARAGAEKKEINTIIHSFNRNFSKRADGNPNTHAFVASPEIVTAIAIAGDLTFNPLTDFLVNEKGEKVKLNVPEGIEIPPNGFSTIRERQQEQVKDTSKINIIVNPNSDRLQLLQPFEAWNGKDFTSMPLLIKIKGKCTTDHISMAGPWLKFRGHLDNISNNMLIGAVNFFNDQTNHVLNNLSGKNEEVPNVARAYKAAGLGIIVVGDENYGEGSSREHAAMEPRFLNVKAVLVKSFARIHETNLKKQGVLALTFNDKSDYDKIKENDKIDIIGLNQFTSGKPLTIVLNHADGTNDKIQANHSYNKLQIEWFKAGSALNMIRTQNKKTK